MRPAEEKDSNCDKQDSTRRHKTALHGGERLRMALIFSALMLLFPVLAWRMHKIQVLEHDRWSALKKRQTEGLEREFPERGRIWESGLGQLVAYSAPRWTAVAEPQKITDPDGVAKRLAPLLKAQEDLLSSRMKNSTRKAIYLQRGLDDEDVDLIRAERIPGIFFEPGSRRVYPQGRTFCHVLGRANEDHGMEGVELRLDSILKGAVGWRRSEYDGRRMPIAIGRGETGGPRFRAAQDGLEIVLTLDLRMQEIAERELDRIMRDYLPISATCTVMDPYTGAILAMAAAPNFDPNRPADYHADERRNRVICDQYEPGSTFKAFVAALALDRGVFKPSDRIFCENGRWRIGYRTLNDVHGYGNLDFSEVIIKSSNIGTAKIGLGLGIDRLYEGVCQFGFGVPTRADLVGEAGGKVRAKRLWKNDSVISVSMGQEVAVTPLQLTAAYAAVVNGGVLLRPQVVRKISSSAGEALYEFQPHQIRRVISPEASRRMRAILERVVIEGTGRKAWCAEYSIGGKTGTAQKVENGRYSQEKMVSSFCGFAPVEEPRLLCLITVDEPDRSRGHFGGTVAAPAAKEVLRRGLALLRVAPRSEEEQAAAKKEYQARRKE